MIYQGKHIYLCNLLIFGQGLVINSKRCIVKPVRDKTKQFVHLDSTADVIQSEIDHCNKIAEIGWFTFMWQTLKDYCTVGHDKAKYEIEADIAEKLPNYELNILLKEYCIKKNLLWY